MKLPQGLPHLDGRRGMIARAIYLALAGLTLVVIAGSLVFNGLDFFRNMPAAMQWGFRTYTSAGHPQIGDTTPEARAAGIRDNDRILAIQGVALAPNATEFTIGARLDQVRGDRLTIVTRNHAGGTGAHVLPRLPNVWQRTEGSSGLPLWLYASGTFFSMRIIPIFLLVASICSIAAARAIPKRCCSRSASCC